MLSCSGRDNSLPCPRNFFVAHHNFASAVFPLFPRSGTVHLERFFVTHTEQHLISHYRFRKVLHRALHRLTRAFGSFFVIASFWAEPITARQEVQREPTYAYVCRRIAVLPILSTFNFHTPTFLIVHGSNINSFRVLFNRVGHLCLDIPRHARSI